MLRAQYLMQLLETAVESEAPMLVEVDRRGVHFVNVLECAGTVLFVVACVWSVQRLTCERC